MQIMKIRKKCSSMRKFNKVFSLDLFNDEQSPDLDSFLPAMGTRNGDTGSMNE